MMLPVAVHLVWRKARRIAKPVLAMATNSPTTVFPKQWGKR